MLEWRRVQRKGSPKTKKRRGGEREAQFFFRQAMPPSLVHEREGVSRFFALKLINFLTHFPFSERLIPRFLNQTFRYSIHLITRSSLLSRLRTHSFALSCSWPRVKKVNSCCSTCVQANQMFLSSMIKSGCQERSKSQQREFQGSADLADFHISYTVFLR